MKTIKRVNIYRILATILITAFVIIECFLLSISKIDYDHARSVNIAEEMAIQLSLINTSFQTGNKATYTTAVADFRVALDAFGKNNYVRSNARDFLRSLQQYSRILMEDSECISQIMELRVATSELSNVAEAATESGIDATKVYEIAQNYIDFREGINKIDAPELTDISEKLASLSNEIIQVAEKSAVCVGICQDNILTEKQKAVEDVVVRYKEELSKMSVDISEKYNPNQLILDLGNYSNV